MSRDCYTDVMGRATAINGVNALELLDGIQITVYKVDAQGNRAANPANLFTSRLGAVAQANPFVTDATGRVSFWADPGDYDILVHDTALPARIGDSVVGWQSVPGADGGIATVQLPDNGRGIYVPGDLKLTAVTALPAGWLWCDGAVVARANYTALFAAIGTSYNIGGEAAANFRLPDFRGRAPFGSDTMGTQGTAGRVTRAAKSIGAASGAEYYKLKAAESGEAGHGHVIHDPGHVHPITRRGFWPGANNIGNILGIGGDAGVGNDPGASTGYVQGSGTNISMDPVGAADAANVHENMPPYQMCHVMIKV